MCKSKNNPYYFTFKTSKDQPTALHNFIHWETFGIRHKSNKGADDTAEKDSGSDQQGAEDDAVPETGGRQRELVTADV